MSWPRWMQPAKIGNPAAAPDSPPQPDAETTDPHVRKLYGPSGEVLRTFSDRPPVGFHQGERSSP